MIPKVVTVFKELEKKYAKVYGYRFENLAKEYIQKHFTLDMFLLVFFKHNNNKCTLFPVKNIVQCGPMTRRSMGDVYRIVKYYFPKVKLIDILQFLYQNAGVTLHCNYCFTIRKRVYRYVEYDHNFYDKEHKDEYGFTWNDYITILEYYKKI